MVDAFQDVLHQLKGPDAPVKGVTLVRVLHAVARHVAGGVRRELAHELGVSPGTVTKAIQLAETVGLVEAAATTTAPGRPGRPSVPLTLSPARFAMIGVAVLAGAERPSRLRGTIIGLDGTPFTGFKQSREVALDAGSLIDQVGTFLENTMLPAFADIQAQWPDQDLAPRLLGCGVGLSGHIHGGVVQTTGWGESTDGWTSTKFADIENRLQVTVTGDNDVNSLAVRLNLRPHDPNADPGSSYAVLTVLEHGVGGALVLADRTRRGRDGMAGESGHLPVGDVILDRPEGDVAERWTFDEMPRCHCERPDDPVRGHVQAFAAPDSIVRRAADLGLVAPGEPNPLAWLSSCQRSEQQAVSRLFHQGGVALGRAVVSVVGWVNPEKIVIHLPPALAEDNPYLAGSCYRDGLREEIGRAFSVDYWREERVILEAVPVAAMEERLAGAAAYLALARLLDTVNPSSS